ncbi:MAG: helix-turn-helix domain-containing protein [Psychromonas sp.]|nr:helix-turn-helix domain-containing protein [Psychromonas sp.]
MSQTKIAEQISMSQSTISRELKRNIRLELLSLKLIRDGSARSNLLK